MRNILLFLFLSSFLFITKKIDAQQRVIWSDVQTHKIMSSNIDGSDQSIVLAGNIADYHVVDFTNSKIYWTDNGMPSVFSCNLDGTNIQTLIPNLVKPNGITLSASNEIYLADGTAIKKYDTNGNFIADVHSNLDEPSDLIIYNSILYWGDYLTDVIEKSALDGSGREVILTGVNNPNDLEVNSVTDELYWIQYTGGIPGSGIFKSNLNGTGKTAVIEKFANGIAIDGVNNYLYWSESTFNNINRTNLADLTDETDLIDEYLPSPQSITLDPTNNKIYFINNQYGDFMFSADLDDGGNYTALLASQVYRPSRFELDTLNEKIYWINNTSSFSADRSGAILRANMDGTNVEPLLIDPEVDRPFGLALDVANNKMYWTDISDDGIFSANLDGTSKTEIVSNLSAPNGLEIDTQNGKLYWTDWSTKKIQRSNLDGSNVEDLIVTDLDIPYEIVVSNIQSKMYWTDTGNGTINRADLDGSNVENVITTDNPSFHKPNSLFLDEENGKIYYTIYFSMEKIQRANMDGTEIEDLIIDLDSPHDIAISGEMLVNNNNIFTAKKQTKISPNPFSENLNIDSKQTIQTVTIFNALGQIQSFEKYINSRKCTLEYLTSLDKGIYFVVVTLDSGELETFKMVKK